MAVINTNVKSLVAREALSQNNRALSTAMERLSTGKRINSAADDAAGLSISSKMTSQVRGLQMAVKNANDAISITQTAEGAMTEISTILQRMRELSVQAASDSNDASDRVTLQAEVTQLADEIDRIASTTQFNGINVLDGGFSDKRFQIGANAGQTMDISVGSMQASALGVASSSATSSVSSASSASSASGVVVVAEGTAATPTIVNLSFGDLATDQGSDVIMFVLNDYGAAGRYPNPGGWSGSVTAVLDMANPFSRNDFVDSLNLSLANSGWWGNSVTGLSAGATTLDTTLSSNYDDLKFSIKVGDNDTANIDILARLTELGTVGAATTLAEMAAAMEVEIRAAFGDTDKTSWFGIEVRAAGDRFTVTDAEGRGIEVTQGAGTGFLFGTDAANSTSPLTSVATSQNNVSAAWSGDEIVLTNSTGGWLTVDQFSSGADTTYMTFAQAADQNLQVPDPVVFGTAATSNISGDDAALFTGRVEESAIAISFSNRTMGGAEGVAQNYFFKLTNGEGIAYFSAALDLASTASDEAIVEEVRNTMRWMLTGWRDEQIDIGEFDIEFSGNTLQITNNKGRALSVEDFASTAGTITVTPLNEIGSSETLASTQNLFSETRIAVGSNFLGVSVGSSGAGFAFHVDGQLMYTAGNALAQINHRGSATTGAQFATAVQTMLNAATAVTLAIGGVATSSLIDVSTFTARFDAATNELVIADSKGRDFSFGLAANNTLLGTGHVLAVDNTQATATNNVTVKTDMVNIVQGDVYEGTEVTLTMNQASQTVGFSVNGLALGAVAYDSDAAFGGSAMEIAMNTLMDTLNQHYIGQAFEYEVNGTEIKILHREGGDVSISGLTTGGVNDDAFRLTIEGKTTDQGATVIAQQNDIYAGVGSTASAHGVLASATSADITFSSDDIYSMTINNGTENYTLSNAVLDVDSSSSRQAFANSLNTALSGSNITAAMDSSGVLTLSRADGGSVGLASFTSNGSSTATFTPAAGQGDAHTLAGTGSLLDSSVSSSSAASSSSSSGSVAQISVLTSAGAAAALNTIDDALTYVNAERSKLGAVENRLGHTIDNLSNVITNTEVARSRIVDTDYGVETAELARSQIIQQAATAMLAQSNQSKQSVLSLLQ
ncbi:flagellin [Burkholderiaceae bacterium]|nr:flagellin [Burkholderiaceae bacterium]